MFWPERRQFSGATSPAEPGEQEVEQFKAPPIEQVEAPALA
jgi:hypothetical protein